jgi:kynurenine formamidase
MAGDDHSHAQAGADPMPPRTTALFLVLASFAFPGYGPQGGVESDASSTPHSEQSDTAPAADSSADADASPTAAGVAAIPAGKVIDLTHPFDARTIYWPNAEGFKLVVDSAQVTDKGYYYAANHFSAAEHGGTHIDAPIHFAAGHPTVDRIPLERLIGPAVLIDVSEKCAADPDYEIGVDDLHGWEEKHGRQLVDVILLLRTGHGKHWPDAEKYLGTAEKGQQAIAKLHFPGLAPEAAKWLVEHRAVKAVGIDTASIDFGQSQLFETHVTLFSHNVPAFENVANLEQLPETGFSIIALPMKIGGGSGGPLRIVAIVP